MRHPVTVLFGIVCIVAASAAIAASGAGAWYGFDADPGVGDEVEQSEDDLRTYSATREQGEVNFIGGVFAATGAFLDSAALVVRLRDVLANLGVPLWAATFAASPVVWSLGLLAIYMISGRSEVRPR
jgi:hypothetical protein